MYEKNLDELSDDELIELIKELRAGCYAISLIQERSSYYGGWNPGGESVTLRVEAKRGTDNLYVVLYKKETKSNRHTGNRTSKLNKKYVGALHELTRQKLISSVSHFFEVSRRLKLSYKRFG